MYKLTSFTGTYACSTTSQSQKGCCPSIDFLPNRNPMVKLTNSDSLRWVVYFKSKRVPFPKAYQSCRLEQRAQWESYRSKYSSARRIETCLYKKLVSNSTFSIGIHDLELKNLLGLKLPSSDGIVPEIALSATEKDSDKSFRLWVRCWAWMRERKQPTTYQDSLINLALSVSFHRWCLERQQTTLWERYEDTCSSDC